ncbi:MAG: tetratricopeptide repeat protein, partial [Desulfobacterales bacterium]
VYKLFDNQQYLKAIEKLETFRAGGKRGFDHYLVDFSMGNAWLQQNDPGRAAPFYQSAVAKNEQLSAAWLNLARCRYELLQFKPAAEAFLKGYETSSPREAMTLYYAAVSWFQAGESIRTVQLMERLLKNHPEDVKPEWKETLVHAYLAVKAPEKALVLMEELVTQFTGEKKVQWQESLLYHYLSMDMKNKALRLAEHLAQTFPVEPKWWKALAHIHLSEDRHSNALAAMTIYGYLKPLDEKETNLMAELNLMLGIPSVAVSYYKSLGDKASSSAVIKKIVQSYQMMNQPEEALKWVEIGLKREHSTDLVMKKANILYELGKFSQSIDAYESVIGKNNGDTGLAWLMIGFAETQNGNLNRAESAFENASKFKRHEKTAISHLQHIRFIKNSES